jgi:type II secretory pathway component PulM
MKKETIKNRFEKYKKGETSLKEEKNLFEEVDENQPEIEVLGDFIKRNKIKTPPNLNDTLWNSFENKTAKNNNFKIGIFSAAASILLLVSLYFNTINKDELSNAEKQALLKEAKSMFSDAEVKQTINNIIIETNFIIVYTKN